MYIFLVYVNYGRYLFYSPNFFSSVQFRRITEQDEGRYLCKAVNNVGDAESVAEVIVIGKSLIV